MLSAKRNAFAEYSFALTGSAEDNLSLISAYKNTRVVSSETIVNNVFKLSIGSAKTDVPKNMKKKKQINLVFTRIGSLRKRKVTAENNGHFLLIDHKFSEILFVIDLHTQ